jgi:hypothetical protein
MRLAIKEIQRVIVAAIVLDLTTPLLSTLAGLGVIDPPEMTTVRTEQSNQDTTLNFPFLNLPNFIYTLRA